MLETDPRIPGEIVARMVLDYPAKRGVGQGPFFQYFSIGRQVGIQGPGRGQNGTSGDTLLPEKLSVLQGGEVEFRTVLLLSRQVEVAHLPLRLGQVRTDGSFPRMHGKAQLGACFLIGLDRPGFLRGRAGWVYHVWM